MAGAYPALHWWPTIVTAWALALMIVACALKISSHKSRSLFQTLVESFATVVLVLVGNALILGVSTWLGLLGIGLVVVIAGLLSISFFRGPAWARWTSAC